MKTSSNGPSDKVLSQVVREMVSAVPWGHHANVLIRVGDPSARLWYLQATARFGWSRNVLLNQIRAGAFERAVADKKSHNFTLALPEALAEQAEEMLKSSYNLEFLGIRRAVRERELEDRLISRLQAFLMELGYGFCFVGRQYRIAAGIFLSGILEQTVQEFRKAGLFRRYRNVRCLPLVAASAQ